VTPTSQSYDLAIVGAGICGLAHALAAARSGKRVVVIDRDAQANGASIRNFGFITVTGQQGGECWRRAKRSVEVWLEIADAAKIPIVQRGLLTIARRPEARGVIEAFLQTDMGAECRLVEPSKLNDYGCGLRANEFAGALYSPHEARVESREAIPQFAAWLSDFLPQIPLRARAARAERMLLLALSLAQGMIGVQLPPELSIALNADTGVQGIATRIGQNLFRPVTNVETDVARWLALLRLSDSGWDRIHSVARFAFGSGPREWRMVALPDSLFAIYPLLRIAGLLRHAPSLFFSPSPEPDEAQGRMQKI